MSDDSEYSSDYGGRYSGRYSEKRCQSCRRYSHRYYDDVKCTDCDYADKKEKSKLKLENKQLKSRLEFIGQLSAFSDVVLFACDPDDPGKDANPTPIPAHRAVLAERSPVLKAMLETKMDESLSGIIKIGDVSHHTLKAFVKYLYTAQATLDEMHATDLLVLAEKYQVAHLKTYCENYLISELDSCNCLSFYVFAREQSAKSLLSEAARFIMANMAEVTKRDEYAKLVERDPRLVVDMYEAAHKSEKHERGSKWE